MSTTSELLIFDVAGVELALQLALIEEVVPATKVTNLPKAPSFLSGVAAVRGKVLGVIDAAKRYGIGPSLSAYFMICKVRDSTTAVAIDRPLNAGKITFRNLDNAEVLALTEKNGIAAKFINGGIEVLEKDMQGVLKGTGRHVQLINPDLFVSDEMASRLSEG